MERPLQSSTRIERGTVIVDVIGQIDMGTSPKLRTTLLESLNGTQRMAINLMAVKYIDSSGIASLVGVLQGSSQIREADDSLWIDGFRLSRIGTHALNRSL